MTDLELAKLDPASEFKNPRQVVEDKTLSRSEKIDILRRWAYDEREKAVAEEENMQSKGEEGENMLDQILAALLQLGVDKDEDTPPPTKQG